MSSNPNNTGGLGYLRVRAPQNFVAGLVLIGACVFVFWAVRNLNLGTLESMGPSMFPRGLAAVLGLGGLFLLTQSFLRDGEPVQKISLRGPVLVTASIVLFALTIRTLGLAVAGTLSLILSGFATEETRPREVVVFAIVITILVIIIFRYMLGMAVPVLVIPGTSIEF